MRDQIPPLIPAISSSGASVPSSNEHKECSYDIGNFHLFPVPEKVWIGESRIFSERKQKTNIIEFATESKIVHLVDIFLRDIINAAEFDLSIQSHLGIKQITPDICILTLGNRLVGVVEVKKPDNTNPLYKSTILGELFDQMILVQGFYGSGPIIGILTTLEEWVFACFPNDAEHFATHSSSTPHGSESFMTPIKNNQLNDDPDSPPGHTPSQQKEDYGHQINETTDVDEFAPGEEVTRKLIVSNVINTSTQYSDVIQYIYTALVRMTQVRIDYYQQYNYLCGFILHKGNDSITWHSKNQQLAALNVNNIDGHTFPRSDTTNLFALEDLGRGASGKVWLMCTLSPNPGICVLKFANDPVNAQTKLNLEKNWWHLIYPEFLKYTNVELWSGTWALMMSHFSVIPPLQRSKFRESIKQLLEQKFQARGLVHPDVAWRNIGFYLDKNNNKIPVLYDLDGILYYSHESNFNWIENAMNKLFPSPCSEEISISKLSLLDEVI